MTDKIALGFILFNPHKDSINRIIDTANLGFEIFLFLNSKLSEEILQSLKSVKSINIIGISLNEGLSIGLSSLCKTAYDNKFKALLYFDQDSIYTQGTLDFALNFFNSVQKDNGNFMQSVACTTFRDTTILSRRFNHISTDQISGYKVENVFFTLNSGTLYYLDKINDYEWFDKRYFVDGVDYSFCINSIMNNFRITEIYNAPGLDHETEQGNMPVKFFTKEKTGRLYPLSRNIDFLKSHLMILLSSFRIRSIKPKIFIMKSICSYIYTQLIFRIKKQS